MSVAPLFPAGPAITVERLLEEISTEPSDGPLVVGDERIREFLSAFGRRLLTPAIARRYPELGSLGFFLRRGEIAKALADVGDRPGALRSPRGLIFHIPPANVDTIFVYSWALAALAGNHNVVRVSSRSAGAAEVVLSTLNEALATAHPAVRQTQRMVRYGRADTVTAALSRACDLRVIWGGDDSVNAIRRHPVRPSARDLTFPDRSSFAVLAVPAWVSATPAERRTVAEGLYNDIYWFDQAACSSPRALFWVGAATDARRAGEELSAELAAVVDERKPAVDAAMAVQKRVATYGLAAAGSATRIRFHGNEVADVELASGATPPREWLGVGTLAQSHVDRLEDLVALIERRDQTITHFGFSAESLTSFVRALGGRGIERLVPIGAALTFTPVWDGYDLLREFTRLTTLATR